MSPLILDIPFCNSSRTSSFPSDHAYLVESLMQKGAAFLMC